MTIISPKRKKAIKMKINLGQEYMSNPQGSSVEICIDAVATSDDGAVVLLKRTLSYAVNTDNIGWKDQVIIALKEQKVEFISDSEQLLGLQNKILNISVDVAKE